MVTGVRRKLATGREAAAPADLALLRAFRKALPRVADDTLGLALSLIGAHQRRLALAELSEGLESGWLLLSLSAPTIGRGGVLMDPVLVSALVQHQTLGAVSSDISDRALTSTDAALAAPLVDDLLKRIRDTSPYSALRVERRMPDVRSLLLPFDAESYLRAELTIDVAVGMHQGRMIFLLPDAPPPEPDEPERNLGEPAMMKDTALQVKAEISAVLGRLSLTLDGLNALQVGQVLALRDARVDKTDLVAIDGRRLATARLGQADGFRAVRINPVGHKPPPLEDSFTDHSPSVGGGAMGGGIGGNPAGGIGGFEPGGLPDMDGIGGGLDDPMGGGLGTDGGAMAPFGSDLAESEITELAGLPSDEPGGVLGDLPDLGGPDSLPDLPDLGMPDVGDGPDTIPGLPDLGI